MYQSFALYFNLRRCYKGIKESEKAIKDADLKLERGESRQALDSADRAAATLRGIGGDQLPPQSPPRQPTSIPATSSSACRSLVSMGPWTWLA